MSDETRPAEEILRDVTAFNETVTSRDYRSRLVVIANRLVDDVELLLRECAELREERDRLADLVDRQLGPCIGCTPQTGPEETCPRDGRSYSEWVEAVGIVQAREIELREQLAELRQGVKARAEQAEATIAKMRSLDRESLDQLLCDAYPDAEGLSVGQVLDVVMPWLGAALAAAGPSAPEPESMPSESYTVEQIRAAWARHSHPDDWGVNCFYEDGLIAALRGEYDREQSAPETPSEDEIDPGIAFARMPRNARRYALAPAGSDEPARCEHGETGAHRMVNLAANFGCAAVDCPGPAASGTPDGGAP